MVVREYETFADAYLGINREILLHPDKVISYMESTRGVVEDIFLSAKSPNCDGIDLAPLGYSPRKWEHLVRTYIDRDSLREFIHKCGTSKGVSIAFDFKRKSSGNGSCMREIILTRKSRKKPWARAKVVWRATELQKRWAADLMLISHILAEIPNMKLEGVDFYIASAYQSGMYVIPLIGSVFGVDVEKLYPAKHPYLKIIRYRNDKYFQEGSPPQKLSPAIMMQKVAKTLREGGTFTPILSEHFTLDL